MKLRYGVSGTVLALLIAAGSGSPASAGAPTVSRPGRLPTAVTAASIPPLQVTTVMSGLDIPWDLTFTPDGTMLFDQRKGVLSARLSNGTVRNVAADFSDLWLKGETGLEGLVVDPGFTANRLFYTCQSHNGAGVPDIRVIKWQINNDYSVATRVSVVVSGISVAEDSGRHAGCRLRFDNNQLLYVGTGDATIGTAPQDLTSLNAKVLRMTTTGAPAPGNPFLSSANARTRLIYTYGHRNVQGLSLRPGTNDMWSVEQGTYRDDEVNRLVAGKNYGYNPIPGYNESVPMTDTRLPNVMSAVYTTGDPTLALSGGTWLSGPAWGSLNGAFIAAALKDTSVRALTISATNSLVSAQSIPALSGTYGRLRSPQLGPDGALYITTSNGGGQDRILRVAPVAAPGDPACLGSRADANAPVGAVTTADGLYAFVVAADKSVQYWTVGRSGFTNLGGQALYGPAVASSDGHRIDLYVTGVDHVVYHRWMINGQWSRGWTSTGGIGTSAPAVMARAPGVLDVYVRSTDNGLWALQVVGAGQGRWVSQRGGLSGGPAAVAAPIAKVGVRGTDRYFYEAKVDGSGNRTTWYNSPGFGICTPPAYAATAGGTVLGYGRSDGSADVVAGGIRESLGGRITGTVALAPARSGPGFAVFARGIKGPLFLFDARDGTFAHGWQMLGGILAP